MDNALTLDSETEVSSHTDISSPAVMQPVRRAHPGPAEHHSGCRANSRRGTTDTARRSYPPVESVRRALDVLKTLNRLRIATVSNLHSETGLPKPTIVRMLDTLISDGYVARDNMCGGYRVTHRVRLLDSGYDGVAQVIEISRPRAVDLTRRIKWPVGIGVLDGDSMAVQLWTGPISPWVHINTLLGHRPKLVTSAMGRAYLAFCKDEEREELIRMLREKPEFEFGPNEELQFRALLAHVREKGYALRAPRTEPRRNTTIAMPIRHDGSVLASMTVSFFTTSVPKNRVSAQIIKPLRDTVQKIEQDFACTCAPHADPVPSYPEAMDALGMEL